MFSCSACFRRAINTLIQDTPSETLPLANILPKPQFSKQQTAHHSTVQSIRKGHHVRVLRKALDSKDEIRSTKRALTRGPSKVTRRDAIAREQNRHHLDVKPAAGADAAAEVDKPGSSGYVHRSSNEEYQLQFLKDPLKLATAVLKRLRIGDVEGALNLVRQSDKENVENVVSWNHLIDYEMNFKNVKGAMKVYNEMKKRGHKPDAHTYTIMLRGFASNINRPQGVENALSVYNSMFAPNSAVTPNIIHTNAVINACARGKDMDALWSVAGKLPERGPGAPDKWTFTTILNALAASAIRDVSQLANKDHDGEATKKVFDAAINDGRKLWEDIVGRWRNGDILIDQPLVCAMGRLLLLGSQPKHWNDVFSLVEQTMNIPKLRSSGNDAPIGIEARKEATESVGSQNEFAPVSVSPPKSLEGKIGATSTSVYAVPGNNALGMLVQAAVMAKNVPAGKMYWELITDKNGPYKVEPDAANMASYLRLLRISRSSKTVVDLLRSPMNESLQRDFFKRGTFVIAMSTCVRDKNNPNVFDHATRVLDCMQEKLEDDEGGLGMDPRVMEMYVSLAVVTTPGLSHVEPLKGQKFVPDLRENNTMRALARLGPSVVNVRDLIKRRVQESDLEDGGDLPNSVIRSLNRGARRGEERTDKSVDDMAAFLQALVGAYDRLLTRKDALPKDYVQDCQAQIKKLSAFVTKMVGGVKPGTKNQEPRKRFPRSSEGRAGREEEDDEADDALTEHVSRFNTRGPREENRGRFKERISKEMAREQHDIGGRNDGFRKHFPSQQAVAEHRRREQTGGISRDEQKDRGLVLRGWGAEFGESGNDKGLGREGERGHGMVV